MSFSQRKGLTPLKRSIQVDDIDQGLRNRLWNALTTHYWKKCLVSSYDPPTPLANLFTQLLDEHLKLSVGLIPSRGPDTVSTLRDYYFKSEWYEAYDFIEFIADRYPDESTNEMFISSCNTILEKESSAYRFVGGKLSQITSEVEIAEIEEVLSSPLQPVSKHIERALDLLSDKESPDYRNSIKESISAVEAISKAFTGSTKSTLGQALEKLEKKIKLHPDLKQAFKNLYGYTSDAEGIRHALMAESNLTHDDAKFMLVSCSAFINYLISKGSKMGIDFIKVSK